MMMSVSVVVVNCVQSPWVNRYGIMSYMNVLVFNIFVWTKSGRPFADY